MPKDTPQQHIERIHKEHISSHPRNLKAFAQTLRSQITTSLKGEHKFVFELLQNAHDAAEKNLEVNVKIITIGKERYLVFSHNGRFFNEDDVEKICSNASSGGKGTTSGNIGFKGIGFKSVFSIANCVYVISNDYIFRFDEKYPGYTGGKEVSQYPWQIIPIWTDLKEVPCQVDTSKVSFVLRLNEGVNITEELSFIQDNLDTLVFLPKLKQVVLEFDPKNSTTIKLDIPDSHPKDQYYLTLSIDKNVTAHWLVKIFPFDIPQEQQAALLGLDSAECPERLKDSKQSAVVFAVPFDEKKGAVLPKKTVLFCGLPTHVNCGFKYLVNADFLLDASRTRLLENAWNSFLLRELANLQFHWLASLSNTPLQLDVLTLLSDDTIKLDVVPDVCSKSFTEGFNRGLSTVAFIPSYDSKKLLRCVEAFVDTIDFVRELNLPSLCAGRSLVLPELRGTTPKLLKRLNILCVDIKYVCDNLEILIDVREKTTIDFQITLIGFLRKNIDVKNDALLKILLGKKFLLIENGELALAAPNTLYFATQQVLEFYLPSHCEIKRVAQKLVQPDPAWQEWFKSLGCKQISLENVIRHYVIPFLENPENQVTKEISVAFVLLLFQAFACEKTDSELNKFIKEKQSIIRSKLLLLSSKDSKDSLVMVSDPTLQLLLPDSYQQEKNSITIPGALFLSEVYLNNKKVWKFIPIEEPTEADIKQQWLEFFTTVFLVQGGGVDIEIIDYLQSDVAQQQGKPNAKLVSEYVCYLQRNVLWPGTTKNIPIFCNFITYSSFADFGKSNIADVFWHKFQDKWGEIALANLPALAYKNGERYRLYPKRIGRNEAANISFLQYVLMNYPFILGSDNMPHRTGELFAPPTNTAASAALVPFVQTFGVVLTDVQIRYCGFKTELSLADCLQQLAELNARNSIDSVAYERILRRLLSLQNARGLDARELSAIINWQGKLPAQNNTLQPTKGPECLRCFPLDCSDAIPIDKKWLKAFPNMQPYELEQISVLFGIKIVEQKDLQWSTEKQVAKEDIKAATEIKMILPIVARIENFVCGGYLNEQEFCDELHGKMKTLKFYQVAIDRTAEVRVKLQGANFYFQSDWRSYRNKESFCSELGKFLDLSKKTCKQLEDFITWTNEMHYWEKMPDAAVEWLEEQYRSKVIPLATITELQQKPTTTTSSSTSKEVSTAAAAATTDPVCTPLQKRVPSHTEPQLTSRTVEEDTIPLKPKTLFPATTKDTTTSPPATSGTNLPELKTPISGSSSSSSSPLRTTSSSHPTKKTSTPIHTAEKDAAIQREKTEIGIKGEQIVFARLKTRFAEKYAAEVEETEDGFTLKGTKTKSISGHNHRLGSQVAVTVIWHNKKAATESPCDFTIKKVFTNSAGSDATEVRERIIEVKSTKSETNKPRFSLSAAEHQLMIDPKNNYRFFRVFDVRGAAPKIQKIKSEEVTLVERAKYDAKFIPKENALF